MTFHRLTQIGEEKGWPPRKRLKLRNCLSPQEMMDLADKDAIPDDEVEGYIYDTHGMEFGPEDY